MSVDAASSETTHLSRIVREIDPSARIVSPRLLRRVVRWHYGLRSGQRPMHTMCFETSREELLELVDRSELGDDAAALPERVLLLPAPDDDETRSPDLVLHDLWRSLFHAAVDRVIDDRNDLSIFQQSQLFTPTIVAELRTVVKGEMRLPPPESDLDLYREFAAFFLELHYFAPHLIADYFPGFLQREQVVKLLEESIDAKALFESTRPPGALLPGLVIREQRKTEPEQPVSALAAENPPAEARAAHVAEIGNDIRAAIEFRRLGKITEAEERLQHLVARLRVPLKLSETDAATWYAALRPLLEPASQGFWPVAGRLLYELQKACLDVERKIYAVDLIECLITAGKHPIKRLLDKPREVNVLRRLRTAMKHAARAAVSIEQREKITQLLHDAIKLGENRVWQENRPVLTEVLDAVGLVPANLPERLARDALIEELLDTLCARGFLKMSDLRDAIARNRLKLEDLSGPVEFFQGDALIQANRQLAYRMDGIYRRGEIYMRGLQRLTSLAFGTRPGRFFTTYIALPFGGAFVLLEGLHHFLEALVDLAHLIVGPHSTTDADAPQVASPLWTSPYTIAVVGVFLLGLIHLPAFRRQVGRSAKALFVELPTSIYESAFVQHLFDNWVTRLVGRYILTPAVIGSVVGLVMRLFRVDWESTLLVSGGVALLSGTLFRTPLGRGLGERFDESLAYLWRRISVNFVLGLLMLILNFFRTVLEFIERGIYAVDEWLRFKEGQSAAAFTFKLLFGTVWFFVAYLFRFAWNLLIEPQINPIKHFPVVTVSHKLLLPMVPSLAKSFDMSLKTTTSIVFFIPGIFGFLVWECKENWKLYRANRSPVIGPVPVGSHGEQIRGLLRPGFHSGIVPKQFAKLRKSETSGRHKKAAQIHHRLEHVGQAVHHFVARNFIAYLRVSQSWEGLPIQIESIRLTTNRIRIILAIFNWEGSLTVSIEERSGWLIGSIEEPGWIGKLSDKQRVTFADVLTYLYKLSGVHVAREQASSMLGIEKHRIDCRSEGLVVLSESRVNDVALDYDTPTMGVSGPVDGKTIEPLAVGDLILSDCPVEWQRWVERWEADQAGKSPMDPLLPRYRVLC